MVKNRVKEKFNTKISQIMREILKKIKKMGSGKWFMLQRINIRENGYKIRNKEKEQWIGIVLMRSTLVNGRMTFKMDMANTIGFKIRLNIKYLKMCIKVIGEEEKGMDLESFSTQMVVSMKDISLIT